MNALTQLQSTAAQRVHEQRFGATLTIFGRKIPCNHSKIERDFELIPGGKSCQTFIMSLTFRKELVGNAVLEKGIRCVLQTATGEWLKLKLWNGGAVTGGQIYEFMAVEENYKA